MQCWAGMSAGLVGLGWAGWAGLGWAGLAGGSLGHSDHLRSDVTWDTEIFRGRGTSSCATDGMFYPISRQLLSSQYRPVTIFRHF